MEEWFEELGGGGGGGGGGCSFETPIKRESGVTRPT